MWAEGDDDRMKQPEITVVVCTFNRYSVLPRCLASLASQTLDAEEYEVLIIDNSNDHAARDGFWRNFRLAENFRVVMLEKSGLSRARNIALAEAVAPLIAFIDDDALASPGWTEALVKAFRTQGAPTVVFGPVRPIWPNGHAPSWIAPEFQAAFTILDLGATSRLAGEHEYGFGANMAFSVAHARQAGGFLENLGRSGRSLISGEDLHLQSEMEKTGQNRYYAADAVVDHHVHEDRLSRSWILARFAWQGVSERIEGTSWSDVDSALQMLSSGRYGPDIAELFRSLFRDEGPDYPNLKHQLIAIKSLVAVLVALNDLDDERLSVFGSDRPDNLTSGKAGLDYLYRWAPFISPTTRLLIVEGAGNRGHHYLLPPLRLLPDMQEVVMDLPVDEPSSEYDGVFEAVAGRSCQILLPTLDNHLYWMNRERFTGLMDRYRLEMSGFLHRLPDNETDGRALREFGKRLKAIFVFAPQIERTLRDSFGIDNAITLPHLAHHAPYMTMSREKARRALGIPADAMVFAQMGEQRPGKGLDHLLAALPRLSDEAKKRLFLILAGKAPSQRIYAARNILDAAGIHYRLDLQDNGVPGDFVVMSEQDYATRIVAADYGCLLFDGPQQNVMSGAFSDFVASGAGVIAAAGTVVGDFVAALGAGHVVATDSPEKLAEALEKIVNSPLRPVRDSPSISDYLRGITPESIADVVAKTLDIDLPTSTTVFEGQGTKTTYSSVPL
jgi:glycosyltransferase involved in cell wall biosynthesis